MKKDPLISVCDSNSGPCWSYMGSQFYQFCKSYRLSKSWEEIETTLKEKFDVGLRHAINDAKQAEKYNFFRTKEDVHRFYSDNLPDA